MAYFRTCALKKWDKFSRELDFWCQGRASRRERVKITYVIILYVIEPELPVIPDGEDLSEVDGNSLHNGSEALVNGVEPEQGTENREVNGVDEVKHGRINPETGEILEKGQDEEQEGIGKLNFAPTTVSVGDG